tara:strand:- start:178 stop:405 length:228 start_codon:yes stop_codon:yes gene_type:complete
MSKKITVTAPSKKISVNSQTKVVSVITPGPQGAKGLELIDTNRVDGSIIRYKASADSYVADADVTPLTLTDGGNF